MKQLDKRIAALEICVAVRPTAKDEAYKRIFSGFRKAVLEHLSPAKLGHCESGAKIMQRSDGPSFEELLRGDVETVAGRRPE